MLGVDPDAVNLFQSFFTFSGRELMELSHFELEDSEVDEITRLGPHHPGSTLPAFYHLYLFDVRQLSSPYLNGTDILPLLAGGPSTNCQHRCRLPI